MRKNKNVSKQKYFKISNLRKGMHFTKNWAKYFAIIILQNVPSTKYSNFEMFQMKGIRSIY